MVALMLLTVVSFLFCLATVIFKLSDNDHGGLYLFIGSLFILIVLFIAEYKVFEEANDLIQQNIHDATGD